jgi:hypothetical protein
MMGTAGASLQLNLHLGDTTAAATGPVMPARAGSSSGVDSTPKAAATAAAQGSLVPVKVEHSAPCKQGTATQQLQGTGSTDASESRVDAVMSGAQAAAGLQELGEGKLLVKGAEGLESPATCGASSAASSAERLHIAGLTHDAQTPGEAVLA